MNTQGDGGIAACSARLKEENRRLRAALKGLSDMYGHAWDLADGGLIMTKASMSRFEAAHADAIEVLQGCEASGSSSSITPQELDSLMKAQRELTIEQCAFQLDQMEAKAREDQDVDCHTYESLHRAQAFRFAAKEIRSLSTPAHKGDG